MAISRRIPAAFAALLGLVVHADASDSAVPPLVVLGSLGITPESLAAAGCATNEASMIVARLQAEADVLNQLDLARNRSSELHAALLAAQEQAALNAADSQAAQMLVDLRVQHAAVVAQEETLRESLVLTLLAELPAAKASLARNYNRASGFRVEPAMRVATLEHADWALVEMALRAEERALAAGKPLESEHAQILSDLRSRTEVVEATQFLALNLRAIRAALADE